MTYRAKLAGEALLWSLLTRACAAGVLHTGAIVIDMPRNSHDYE